MKSKILTLILMTAASSFCLAQRPGNPESNGLVPTTGTFYVNTNFANNGGAEAPGVGIAANGNVFIGWEDDGAGIADMEAVWSLYDGNGNRLTPTTVQTAYDGSTTITNTFLSFFRNNGSPMPGYAAWGPKIKANLFGNGLGMGATGYGFGVDVLSPEFEAIQNNAIPDNAGDFPAVQLLDNNGNPVKAVSGAADADVEVDGDVRIADWDYLSNGNIVIVGESRQEADLVDKFGGSTARRHAVYRIVTPAGVEVKSYSLVSASNEDRVEIWHGVGVTANGFAVRFRVTNPETIQVRMFDNAGNPTTGNIDLGALTGNPAAVGVGNRGDGVGFHGNGTDAYLHICTGAGGPWMTVLNANGTLRWARSVADASETIGSDRLDGAIAADGRVIAVWDSGLVNATPDVTNRLVQARLFSPGGQPFGARFAVSEWENPNNPATINISSTPRVAWRGDKIAIVWQSQNAPTVLSDPLAPPFDTVLAARLFTVGLIPTTGTFYVNTNFANNGGAEAPGVGIAANGNVFIGWEDDGAGIADMEAVWSLYDGNGNRLTPTTVQTAYDGSTTITNTFLSFFRNNGSPMPGYAAWGPKIKANLFGNGLGMGATGYGFGVDVLSPEFEAIQNNAIPDNAGDFPAVQLLDNNGNPVKAVSGAADADVEVDGDVRIADWDYLSNGNIVIVGESRQEADLVDKFGGSTARRHAVYRIVTPAGVEVKSYSLVSASNEDRVEIWHGVGVTANGFAVRFRVTNPETIQVRMFDNAGNPTTGNIDLGALTGNPAAVGVGNRGDGVGFHGNGTDAYLHICTGAGGPWMTVLNANGTLRWARSVADASETIGSDRLDGAIAADGRVIAVWDSGLVNATPDVTNRLVQARLFSPGGQPFGARFAVSEWENPNNPATINISSTPRVAWRGDKIAIVWQSQNAPTVLSDPLAPPFDTVLAARLFTAISPSGLSLSKAGGNFTVTWAGGGTLESADEITGPWTQNVGAVSPYTFASGGSKKFFRVRAW